MNIKLQKRLMNHEPLIWSWMLCILENGQKTLVGVQSVSVIQREKKICGGASPRQKPLAYI